MIVPRAIVHQAGPILLPPCVLVTVRTRDAGLRRKPKGLIGVLRLQRAGVVAKCHRGAEGIGQERPHACAIGAREELIEIEAREEIGRHRGAVLLLHGIEAVIEKVGGDPLNRFAGAAAKGIVGERDRKARGGDIRELVPDVPAVGRGAAGIGHRRQVAVKVVGLRIGSECQLLIVSIVAGGGEHGR